MGEVEGISEALAEMKRLWAGRRNGGVCFGNRFGVTVRLAKQEGNWLERGRLRETVRVREDNVYKGRKFLNY